MFFLDICLVLFGEVVEPFQSNRTKAKQPAKQTSNRKLSLCLTGGELSCSRGLYNGRQSHQNFGRLRYFGREVCSGSPSGC